MGTVKQLFHKYREIIMYLIFGVLTTVVGIGTYTLIMDVAAPAMGFDLADKNSATYLAVYTAAQIIQWVAAVLFAFFTNKKWVFTEARPEPLVKQLITFSASRLVTLGLDIVITYLGVLLFAAIWPDGLTIILTFSPEFMAKIVASVVVVVGNYVLSKLFVFRKT